MAFVNSVKLFCSNWEKVLKLFLYYIVVFGITICLLLPAFFEFGTIISNNVNSYDFSNYLTIFHSSFGVYLHNCFAVTFNIFLECANANLGLLIYALIVIYFLMPFLFSIGKYVFCEMLYGYMASQSKVGFFSALFKTLNKSLLYALIKTLYNLLFMALTTYLVFLVGLSEGEYFQTYFLPLCEILLLTILFTLNKLFTTGWAPAIIVFDCSVFAGFVRGARVVARRFLKTFFVGLIIFLIFFLFTYIMGIYSLFVTIPLITAELCMFDMITFFTSQGMRYYINKKIIMTPKMLEEVDKISKTKYII